MDVEALEGEALAAIAEARSADELEEVRVRTLGRKSPLKLALREVRDRESGMALNAVREQVEQALASRQAELTMPTDDPTFDPTLPGDELPRGSYHLLTQLRRQIEDVFIGMGYEIFRQRPMWAELTIAVIACGALLLLVGFLDRYYLPPALAAQAGKAGQNISLGLAYPVLIAIGVGIVMTFIATRRRFGRSVYAIGGNPEAAELAGIKTRRTIVKTFTLMGLLVGLAAAVQIARLNAAVSSLGTGMELNVIAAAVIGGTSFAGGVGTIVGALLGALIMQSLVSGMVLMGIEAPLQDIVVGIVLVLAVTLDTVVRRRAAK